MTPLPPKYEAYLFDMDGTLCRGGRPLPGAVDVLSSIRANGHRFAVMSNNPLISPEQHAHELREMGLPVQPENVMTSVTALVTHLRQSPPDGPVYIVGETALVEHVRVSGIPLSSDPDEIACVVAAFDRTFDYRKWTTAFRAIRNGADFIATNADATFPTASGEIPDCGGIIAALEVSTGRQINQILGKPSERFLDAALEHLAVTRDRVLVVGDRLETDITMGVRHAVDTALVLTGVTEPGDPRIADIGPTFVLPGIHALLEMP